MRMDCMVNSYQGKDEMEFSSDLTSETMAVIQIICLDGAEAIIDHLVNHNSLHVYTAHPFSPTASTRGLATC